MTVDGTDRRPASIRDVARLAGVSHQTVSRVLNDSPSIRDETRARVLDAMGRLQYRPNRAARVLVTSRSRTIGILTSDRMHYGPSSSIVAIEAAARAAGYSVVTANLPSTEPQAIAAALDHLLDQAVEGLVVIAPQARVSTAISSLASRVPYVTLQSAGADESHSVSVDQIAGARLATRHLLDLGHRRIRHVSGPPDWMEAEGRMRGFLAELADWGVPSGEISAGDWTADSGYRAGQALLAEGGVTAVFAGNDQMALGVLHAVREAGLDCPGDVSVVGFDDMPEARHFAPALTTVRQDFGELGRRCVIRLLGELEDGRTYSGSIAPELVVRSSTAAASC
ncbi:LacI family DNA-binding transcriptional regulator [Naasia sp. SYSU D00948]|uniref:LacI family DNA-binding transcriptional regulator n=1 Tax=Naasia sp. SYSU D00948 TaxID=2817379 RepID=UPI001B30180A|nr:LacI family DNA-binding transcriptional regulator [Naasia sp. SYSU D00948]